MDNTPLWDSRQEGDKTPQKDLIYQQFKKANVPISQKAFRSIAATWLESPTRPTGVTFPTSWATARGASPTGTTRPRARKSSTMSLLVKE